jgi:N-acetylmuramoyl-L-alanine amidase
MVKVCLDPGHGGRDSGAVNGSRHEADDNLRMALAAGAVLERQGVAVAYTRTTDVYMDFVPRLNAAKGADMMLSIHRNAFSAASAHGVEVLYRYDASIPAARAVLAEVLAVAGMADRGVKKFQAGVLSGEGRPGCLAELGFISNAGDNALYDEHFDAYATALARGAMAALGLPWKDDEKEDVEVRYKDIADIPEWGKKTVRKLLDRSLLAGKGEAGLDLSEDMLRLFVVNDRAGLYDAAKPGQG